jgi:AhpD family alkylhydroperoxidase
MSGAPLSLEYEDFGSAAPGAVSALLALGKIVDDSGLEKDLTELVKLRASQINGCAFCIQFHLDKARDLRIPEEKLDLLNAWRDAGVYTDREKAALEYGEALTQIADDKLTDALRSSVAKHFTRNEALFLTLTIATINQWNRIAGALRFSPHVSRRSAA